MFGDNSREQFREYLNQHKLLKIAMNGFNTGVVVALLAAFVVWLSKWSEVLL